MPDLLTQADNPGYPQSLAGQYVRSHGTEDDALGHQESGFIRTGAEAAGRSARDFGASQQFPTKPTSANWTEPHPGDSKICALGQVPGASSLSSESE